MYIDDESRESEAGQQLLDSFCLPEVLPSARGGSLDIRRLAVPLSAGGLMETMQEHVRSRSNSYFMTNSPLFDYLNFPLAYLIPAASLGVGPSA